MYGLTRALWRERLGVHQVLFAGVEYLAHGIDENAVEFHLPAQLLALSSSLALRAILLAGGFLLTVLPCSCTVLRTVL